MHVSLWDIPLMNLAGTQTPRALPPPDGTTAAGWRLNYTINNPDTSTTTTTTTETPSVTRSLILDSDTSTAILALFSLLVYFATYALLALGS